MKNSALAFRGLCMQHGYNSRRLAEEIGLSDSEFSNRVRSVVPWRWPEVVQICNALGISLEEFSHYY